MPLLVALLILAIAPPAYAMHLAEGILPMPWAGFWTLVCLPFLFAGARLLKRREAASPYAKPFVAMTAAAVFLLSCMPIPVPVAGSSSHPCGTAMAAILIGPRQTVIVSVVALFIQALLLAHGGFTTLGADVASMGIAGAYVGYGVYHLLLPRLGASAAAFLAGLLGDWATYTVTALELASALHGHTPFLRAWGSLILAFAPTQVPLGLLEGAVTMGAIRFLSRRRPDILQAFGVRYA